MQAIPIALLALVLLLDLVYALVHSLILFDIITLEIPRQLWQLNTILGMALSLLATLISAIFLATKKFSLLAMGFMVTLLCALFCAINAIYTVNWFL